MYLEKSAKYKQQRSTRMQGARLDPPLRKPACEEHMYMPVPVEIPHTLASAGLLLPNLLPPLPTQGPLHK